MTPKASVKAEEKNLFTQQRLKFKKKLGNGSVIIDVLVCKLWVEYTEGWLRKGISKNMWI